jgi:hypothetical protein
MRNIELYTTPQRILNRSDITQSKSKVMEGEKLQGVTSEERAEEHLEVATDDGIVAHTDTFDISRDALGRPLPKHYYLHWRFVGLALVC